MSDGELQEGQNLQGNIRIQGLFSFKGKEFIKNSKAKAGDIIALSRIESIKTGDLISDEKKEENIESSSSNGLENFDFNENETLELFNSDGEKDENNEDSFLSSETSEKEEDELEIPAFLRRQKN